MVTIALKIIDLQMRTTAKLWICLKCRLPNIVNCSSKWLSILGFIILKLSFPFTFKSFMCENLMLKNKIL